MQPPIETTRDEDEEALDDFERGSLAAVLFTRGVTRHPSFEDFRDALHVLNAYANSLQGTPPTRN